jgi:prepilin-type processing-associated H-X9-DG protein
MESKTNITQKGLITVVICIIFLFLILEAMGASGRKRAKEMICLSNLHQWGIVWAQYLEDNDQTFPEGWVGTMEESTFWNEVLPPYFKGEKKLALCPEATKTYWRDDGNRGEGRTPFGAWGVFEGDGGVALPYVFKGDYGSYGINNWVENHPMSTDHWKNSLVSGGNNIPLFGDCSWMFARPYHTDSPPAQTGDVGGGGWGSMKRFAVDRHDGKMNMLFVDFSARSVGLKGLWKLKWHKEFDTSGWQYEWPEWMRPIPEE